LICARLISVLSAELHAIEARLAERAQPLARERHAARDKAHVEIDLSRRADDLFEVPPNERLSSREMHLDHAQRLGLAEHARPLGRRELVLPARVIKRI
jgi:hypothetical protein